MQSIKCDIARVCEHTDSYSKLQIHWERQMKRCLLVAFFCFKSNKRAFCESGSARVSAKLKIPRKLRKQLSGFLERIEHAASASEWSEKSFNKLLIISNSIVFSPAWPIDWILRSFYSNLDCKINTNKLFNFPLHANKQQRLGWIGQDLILLSFGGSKILNS